MDMKWLAALMLSLTLVSGLQLGSPQPPPSSSQSRRSFLTQTASTLLLAPLAAGADVRGANENMPKNMKEVNKFLTNLGFPEMTPANGLSPLLEYIGTAAAANIDGFKTKERPYKETLLVRFLYPSGWLTEVPSITENGEAGNIGANNYLKGDSCNFAAATRPAGKNLAELDKEYFKSFISTQMTNDVYEDVKIKKVKMVTTPDGVELAEFDFTYSLLTRAGFTVNRRGVAACQVMGDSIVGLVAATTELRWKELEPALRQSVDSFRAYSVKAPAFPGSIV